MPRCPITPLLGRILENEISIGLGTGKEKISGKYREDWCNGARVLRATKFASENINIDYSDENRIIIILMKTDLLPFFREGTTAIQKTLFTCCSVNAAAKSIWVVLKPKFRQRFKVYKSYFRSYARKRDQGTLERGKTIPQANFFSHFFEADHSGKFDATIKIIDGAENVFSLRRKELFWQYKLGTFLPRGLNERAADVELDMFACGMA